ncbi:MAG: hemolysin family protein [Acidobacteriota bacterium]|nr:hemolysin family protein [Acidobacteriota bacterium]
MGLGVVGVISFLILATALYVAAEFAVVSVRRSRVRRLAEDGNTLAARLLPYVDDSHKLDEYVAVSQIGITLSSLVLGAYAQARLAGPIAPFFEQQFTLTPESAQNAAATAILIVLTALAMIVGELVPKSLALQFSTETALWTVLPMRASLWVFRPLIFLLNGSGSLVLRLFGARSSGHRHVHSPEEIEMLIAESRDGGLLEPDEQQRLHRALRLSQKTARDLMVPGEQLAMIAADMPLDQVMQIAAASPYSRLPVYRGTRDHVIGTLRTKDLALRFIEGGTAPLDRILRPVATVEPDLPADRLLAFLREKRVHQAVVVDGGLLGLVTIQDVLGAFLSDTGTGTNPS